MADAKTTSSERCEKSVSLRNSTSSDFNTWTMLPAEKIEPIDNTGHEEPKATTSFIHKVDSPTDTSSCHNKESEKHANDKCKSIDDSQVEDTSDGISIISDSESTGRMSPHRFLSEQLSELHLKFRADDELPASLCHPSPDFEEPILLSSHGFDREHTRRRQRPASASGVEHINEAPAVSAEAQLDTPKAIVRQKYITPLVQNSLTALFYVGATLAILAFIGKLRYPEWQVLGNGTPLVDLEQRLNELELQNNLMRAEIDIMTKQVNFLSSVAAGQGQERGKPQEYNQRKGKTFKAWPGNGNSVDAVDITKGDLKRPYACPDGKFVEFAAMCLEKQPHAESLADEIGDVVNNVLQSSQTFQHFEKVTEQIDKLVGNTNDGSKPAPQASASNFQARAQTSSEQARHESKSPPTADGSYPNRKQDPYYREQYKPKHHHSYEDSKERRSSKEGHRHYSDKKNNSKERYNKYQKYDKSGESQANSKQGHKNGHHDDDDDSGSMEWHEKMMLHREHVRHQNEQRNKKNWYIERGDSREQKRQPVIDTRS